MQEMYLHVLLRWTMDSWSLGVIQVMLASLSTEISEDQQHGLHQAAKHPCTLPIQVVISCWLFVANTEAVML